MTNPNFVLVDQSFSKKTGQVPLALSNYNLPTTVTTGTYVADILNVRPGLAPTVEPFWNYTVGGSELSGWTLLVGAIPPTIPSTLRIIAGGQVARYALFPNVISTLGTLTLSGALNNGTATSGSIIGATPGSTIVSNVTGLTVDSINRTYSFNGSASASTISNGLVETLSGAIGSPKNNSITVLAALVTLGTLAFNSLPNPLYTGSSASGTITGATSGSTITASGLPSGFTINGAARTWAWSGTGTAATTSVSLIETLAGATNTPRTTSGLSITVAAPTVTAPVITRTSTANANPFLWTTAENATFFPGYYWNVQTATGADTTAAASNLAAGTTTADIIQQIDTSDLAGTAPITFTGLTSTSADGAFAIRERVGVEDGAGGYNWGPWSNVLTDTIATPSTPAVWVSTNGVNKSQYVTVSGSNLVVTGQSGFNGAPISVRTDQARTGKRQFQVTLTNTSNLKTWIGVDDGTTNYNSGFVRPGYSNASGVSLVVLDNGTGWSIYSGGSTTAVQTGSLINNVNVEGDSFFTVFDTVGHTIAFYQKRGGTTVQLGTTLTLPTFTSYYANVGAETTTIATATFGNGQDRTLDSGYSTYG